MLAVHRVSAWGGIVLDAFFFLPVMSPRARDVGLRGCQRRSGRSHSGKRTNIEQNCAILLFLDDVVLEDLVVQGPWRLHGRRHGVYIYGVQVARKVN